MTSRPSGRNRGQIGTRSAVIVGAIGVVAFVIGLLVDNKYVATPGLALTLYGGAMTLLARTRGRG